jgi:hypothetical protein
MGWMCLTAPKICLNLSYLNFKFQIVHSMSREEITKTKVVTLNEVYNFFIDDFFI